MASPCEILIETQNKKTARAIAQLAEQEARRIEQKFSRYRNDNIIYKLNHSAGKPVSLDDETDRLIQFAFQCYQISDGLFDITSGILRKVWRFKDQRELPDQNDIDQLLPHIGMQKLDYKSSRLQVPAGMQIDLGGIGKEYAVDRIIGLIQARFDQAVLVNLGGDISTCGKRQSEPHWSVGIENPDQQKTALSLIQITQGSLATSGDAYRYIEHNGIRYGHILNPNTGWPIPDSPRSVTVGARTCTDAGIIATLAMLQGQDAESFLQQQDLPFYCHR